ncbi:phosphomethylpyrimidine kinase family protein [Streptococcus pyogenes]|uniref:pyridoxamine kinase n=1 Tax=Streptococcus pyogenes TaxID=1314 RepID=UPI0010A11228|nr:pyridoxamine kinase [Streptococcus pyogenes]VHE85760.1 phosphomethylpyrimidine kinase family protein [Streptococcus pyogenes]
MKRIVVANDLVGVGKVALSASIPLMASCLLEQVLLPTCLLSSHTGGGQSPVKHTTSSILDVFLTDWDNKRIKFDGIFIGYFTTTRDGQKLLEWLSRKQLPLILDPIMADNGKLYQGFSQKHIEIMIKLTQKAELVLPNISEACLLTQTAYLAKNYDEEDIRQVARKLAKLGPKQVVISGISFEEGSIGFAYYQSDSDQLTFHFGKQFPYHFYGTGDIASAIITAGFYYQLPLTQILDLVVSFLEKVLQNTLTLKRDLILGVAYESHLNYLTKPFKKLLEEKNVISKIS